MFFTLSVGGMGYAFGLCSAGWLALHILVSLHVIVFSQAEEHGGRELAVTLSGSLGNVGMAVLCGIFLFVGVPLLKLIIDILRKKTCLRRTAVLFSPIIPMTVIFVIAYLLPSSPFSYGLYTFCMNGGMLVWFAYLLAVNRKG